MSDNYLIEITTTDGNQKRLHYYELGEYFQEIVSKSTLSEEEKMRYEKYRTNYFSDVSARADYCVYELNCILRGVLFNHDTYQVGHDNKLYEIDDKNSKRRNPENISMIGLKENNVAAYSYKRVLTAEEFYYMNGIISPDGKGIFYRDSSIKNIEYGHYQIASKMVHDNLITDKEECKEFLDYLKRHAEASKDHKLLTTNYLVSNKDHDMSYCIGRDGIIFARLKDEQTEKQKNVNLKLELIVKRQFRQQD